MRTSVCFIGGLIFCVKRPSDGIVEYSLREILEVSDIVDLADVWVELPIAILVSACCPDYGRKREKLALHRITEVESVVLTLFRRKCSCVPNPGAIRPPAKTRKVMKLLRKKVFSRS